MTRIALRPGETLAEYAFRITEELAASRQNAVSLAEAIERVQKEIRRAHEEVKANAAYAQDLWDALVKEHNTLKAKLTDTQAQVREREQCMQEWWTLRGVETPCPACQGAGSRVYPSTATWRGGIGGHMMTRGVCDVCWGSGEKGRPWLSHRAMEMKERALLKDIEALKAKLAGRGDGWSDEPGE